MEMDNLLKVQENSSDNQDLDQIKRSWEGGMNYKQLFKGQLAIHLLHIPC